MSKSYVGMALCFWCGESKHIIMDRRIKETLEQSAVYDLDPCEKCQEGMNSGFTVYEVTTDSTQIEQFPEHMRIVQGERTAVFTGAYVVIDPESNLAKDFANEENKLLMDSETFQDIFGEHLKGENK